MRIAADVAVRIVEPSGRILEQRPVAPRRRAGVDVVALARREVVADPVGGPHRRPAVAVDVPRHARRAARSSATASSARSCQAGNPSSPGYRRPAGRPQEHLARDVLPEIVDVPVVDRAVGHALAEERLPPKTGVHRDARARPPRVLARRRPGTTCPSAAGSPAPCSSVETRPSRKSASPRPVFCPFTVHVPPTRALVRKSIVRYATLTPTAQLMVAAHHREIVRHLVAVGVEDAAVHAADANAPVTAEGHLAGVVVVDVRPDVVRREPLLRAARDPRAVVGHAHRLHGVVAEHHRVAERRSP